MADDKGVTLIARHADGSIAISQYLPGPISLEQVRLDAAHFAEDTGLKVEFRYHQPDFPVHIGRRLEPQRSRLIDDAPAGLACEPLPPGIGIGPVTLLPVHRRR